MSVIGQSQFKTYEHGTTRFTSCATPALGSLETSVWQVEIAPGTPPAPHSVSREEIFFLLEGEAEVTLGQIVSSVKAGDALIVPADTSFQLYNSGDEPLRALCCLPVGGQACLNNGQPFTPPWAQ